MKPIPAIVEPAPIDVDEIAEQVIAALGAQRQAERSIGILETELANARGAARMRRIEVGLLLAKVRGAWPSSGPKARGWSEFLARVKLDDSTAHRYIKEAKDPEGFSQPREKSAGADEQEDDDDGQTGPKIIPAGREASTPPFRALGEADIIATMGELEQAMARLPLDARKRVESARRKARGVANLIGGSGEVDRGKWCTSEKWARAVGSVDLDPFSNPNSLVAARARCMLENGGDGFGGVAPGSSPGLHLIGGAAGATQLSAVADAETRVWIQPPYDIVLDVIAHYGHTRFIALLRFSPDVEWYRRLMPLTCAVAFPLERMAFKAPPGIPDPDAPIPYPHALYYADARDITPEVRALCQIWIVDHEQRPPLHIVH